MNARNPIFLKPVPGQSTCPRCGQLGTWELHLMSDEPIILCLGCCDARIRKRIEKELHDAYCYANLDQLAGPELDLRLISIRQRCKAVERLALNYQKMRRLK